MKNVLKVCLATITLIIPISSFAQSSNIVAKEEKYYKTTTMYSDFTTYSLEEHIPLSYTEEISEDEYDNYNPIGDVTDGNVTVETTYKKLATTIAKDGNDYRYEATLTWKNFPKVRSYDTIAIGYYASVKPLFDPDFEQTYCLTNGDCRTIQAFYPQIFTNGSAATFKLPTGTLKSLKQTIGLDMIKSSASTVISQKATGDYAHAVKTVSVEKAKDFTVSNIGITFASSSEDYFDNMGYAQATWSGSW